MDIRFTLANKQDQKSEKNSEQTALIQSAGGVFIHASDKGRNIATWRSSLIYAWKSSGLKKHEYIEAYNDQVADQAIYKKLGPVSLSTFYRWLKDFHQEGASGITPRYGMSRGGAGESLTDIEKILLKRFWLKSTQPTASHAYRLMKENVPYSRCSYQTALRYLNSLPKAYADYHRLGKSRFENLHLPYLEQDIYRYRSLDMVVSDHHCMDCVVDYRGKLVRPWMTTFQDYRSGKILGWCPSIKPSSLSIIVAYYMCVMQYGVPKVLLFDNGKDYRSKLLNGSIEKVKVLTPEGTTEEGEVELQGIFGLIGSSVRFTRVYNGKSKGRQERYYRLLGEYLAKDIGSYMGSDTRTRPEEAALMFRSINGMAKRHDIPTWEDFVEAADNMVRGINDRFESHGKGMNGKTRSQVFAENLPPDSERRYVNKEELVKALRGGQIRKCKRNGVKVNGINYWDIELTAFSGMDVVVYTSLISDEEVSVFSTNGQFICHAKGDFFREGSDFKETIERLSRARKAGLQKMAELGRDEVDIDPAYKTMLDVNASIYGQNHTASVDDLLELPVAAGAEDRKREPSKRESNIKGLLQASNDDWSDE
jgi:hypothetical protein